MVGFSMRTFIFLLYSSKLFDTRVTRVVCVLFCSRLPANEGGVAAKRFTLDASHHSLSSGLFSGFDLKAEQIQRSKKLMLFFFLGGGCPFSFSCIHLYPHTQHSEPILIWPCSPLGSPYWKSKYSHSDKSKMERSAFTRDVR